MIPLFHEKPCGLPFKEAFKRCSALRKYETLDNQIDLGNPKALLLYNRLVLQDFMGIDFTIPSGYLIPAICSRWEFVNWIIRDKGPSKILEIGTGASAILAMMFAKVGCHVEATESDELALENALNNVKLNNLESQILLRKVKTNCILRHYYDSLVEFDAIVCNPPQYDQNFFFLHSSKKGFVGKEFELVGGQKGHEFIVRLLEEVKSFRNPPKVYFQLTFPKLNKSISNYLQKQDYLFRKVHRTVGTRQRYYYRVD
ncbi:MAG: RlmF-related methyltransferase [Candidatus Hodarchaeota archaeon]